MEEKQPTPTQPTRTWELFHERKERDNATGVGVEATALVYKGSGTKMEVGKRGIRLQELAQLHTGKETT